REKPMESRLDEALLVLARLVAVFLVAQLKVRHEPSNALSQVSLAPGHRSLRPEDENPAALDNQRRDAVALHDQPPVDLLEHALETESAKQCRRDFGARRRCRDVDRHSNRHARPRKLSAFGYVLELDGNAIDDAFRGELSLLVAETAGGRLDEEIGRAHV